MARTKEYRVVVSDDEILLNQNLNGTEVRAANAIRRGLLDELKLSGRTYTRTIGALKKHGIIEEVEQEEPQPLQETDTPKDAAAAWLTGAPPLGEDDGAVEFIEHGIPEIAAMGKNGRFFTFCEVYGADGNDKATRAAWVKLESDNSRKDGDGIREIVYLYPQILQSAQHEAYWQRTGIRKAPPADVWLSEGRYDSAEYNVLPGDPPGVGESEEAYRERITEAEQALMSMGCQDFEGAHSWEKPRQAARRLEAKLASERKLAAMR